MTLGGSYTNPQVTLYEHGDYGGFSNSYTAGNYDCGNLHNGDTLSSFTVPRNLVLRLNQHCFSYGNDG